MERRILSHKFKEFQTVELLVNKGLETSSLTENFLTFLKEIEGTTVQLLGGDCILMDVVCFTDFHHHHLCHSTLGLFLSSLLYFVL